MSSKAFLTNQKAGLVINVFHTKELSKTQLPLTDLCNTHREYFACVDLWRSPTFHLTPPD